MKKMTVLNGSFVLQREGDKQVAICIHCNARFKYHHSTSSLKYHLTRKHPASASSSSSASTIESIDVTMLLPVKEEAKDKSKQGKVAKTTTNAQISSNDRQGLHSAEDDALTDSICLWIVKDLRPDSIVEDNGFNDVLRLATGNANYKLPSRQTITRRTKDLYQTKRVEINSLLSSASIIALATDSWTCSSNSSYISIEAFFIDSEWNYRNVTLGTAYVSEPRIPAQICENVTSLVQSWQMDTSKVKYICTDDAWSMLQAVNDMGKMHTPCLAYSLQSSVDVGLKACDIEAALAKARKIVGYFNHFERRLGFLSTTGRSELVQDVPTRWGSTLLMMDRLIANKAELLQTLSSHQHSLALLTEAEWDTLERVSGLLRPCEEAIKLLGADKYASCSTVLPMAALLRKTMEYSDDDPGYVAIFKQAVIGEINSRLEKIEDCAHLTIASALDIRFKKLKFIRKESRDSIWTLIEQLMFDLDISAKSNPPPSKRGKPDAGLFSCIDSTSDDDVDSDDHMIELAMYKRIDSNEQQNPLEFWKANHSTLPRLALLSKDYLSIPASSVPVGRMLSKDGDLDLLSERRNSISPENVNVVLPLSCWLKE